MLLGRLANLTVLTTVVVAHIVPKVVHPTSFAQHAHLLAVKVSVLVRLSASLISPEPIIPTVVIVAIVAAVPTISVAEVALA